MAKLQISPLMYSVVNVGSVPLYYSIFRRGGTSHPSPADRNTRTGMIFFFQANFMALVHPKGSPFPRSWLFVPFCLSQHHLNWWFCGAVGKDSDRKSGDSCARLSFAFMELCDPGWVSPTLWDSAFLYGWQGIEGLFLFWPFLVLQTFEIVLMGPWGKRDVWEQESLEALHLGI